MTNKNSDSVVCVGCSFVCVCLLFLSFAIYFLCMLHVCLLVYNLFMYLFARTHFGLFVFVLSLCAFVRLSVNLSVRCWSVCLFGGLLSFFVVVLLDVALLYESPRRKPGWRFTAGSTLPAAFTSDNVCFWQLQIQFLNFLCTQFQIHNSRKLEDLLIFTLTEFKLWW